MTHWQNDPFFQYPLTYFKGSEGDVALPILYYDNSNLLALFYVDYDPLNDLLKDQGLAALRFFGHKAMVVVAFYEYRDTAVGVYNEVGVAAACIPHGMTPPLLSHLSVVRALDKRQTGFHILDLPVTTKAAWAAGREIWSYPKFVTDIGFSLTGRRFHGTVADPGTQETMIELSGHMGLGLPAPQLDLVLYSKHRGKLLRTLVNTRGGGYAHLPGSMQLKVLGANHPMAQRLELLGLKNATPVAVFKSHALQLRLNAGAEI